MPLKVTPLKVVSFLQLPLILAPTVHLRRRSFFDVRTMVDSMMVTNSFSCQPLPSGTAQGIATALKRNMAHAGLDLEVRIPKLDI